MESITIFHVSTRNRFALISFAIGFVYSIDVFRMYSCVSLVNIYYYQ